MNPESIARTAHRASGFIIEVLEENGGFILQAFGKNSEPFLWPFCAGDAPPHTMLRMALNLLFEANAKLHRQGLGAPLAETDQKLLTDLRLLIGSFELFLAKEISA
jgi:hypothetical protein